MDATTPSIRNLYPRLSDEELAEAEENLDRYVEHALRMYERIKRDPETPARFRALTASLRKAYDTEQKVDRSSINPT